MDVLLALFAFLTLLLVWFGPACWAARRGIGTRWTWLGGGIGGLLLVVLMGALSIILERPAPVRTPLQGPPSSQVTSSGGEEVGFEPAEEPAETALGFFCVYGVMGSIAFVVAAIFYKPRRQTSFSLFKRPEESIPNAGRAN